jgi:GntR family transcriptional regulator
MLYPYPTLGWVSMARLCVGRLVTVCDVGIDPDAPDWPYQQVAAKIRERIRAGELGPRLPSYVTLAHELEVSPMTVQRAIGILRDEGLVVTYPGRGTFVAKPA